MKGTISTADLEELGACQDQIDRFREIFKDADTGVAVDVENVLAADAGGLKLAWLARHVFTTQCHGEYVAAFDRILVECHHAVRRAYDEFARELAGLDGEGGDRRLHWASAAWPLLAPGTIAIGRWPVRG